ncbi:Flp family type IVb pilin [Vibrio nitrifigilis]|uniref:Flp family type IVb pilin n=1 Tax=Vibrio nitrifigilis TaxID=2789781 RepID=A0ABS0GIG0_9VIBR|nr:Flp family type IVb pilin [Vibrio nitrifigilis]MBF9002222.1 Flp family type IVb pilin [Vibrio nitrifigilis]
MLMNLSSKLYSTVDAFFSDKRGVTAIEYAIIGVAVSAIVLSMFNSSLSDSLEGAMSTITTNIDSASSSAQ